MKEQTLKILIEKLENYQKTLEFCDFKISAYTGFLDSGSPNILRAIDEYKSQILYISSKIQELKNCIAWLNKLEVKELEPNNIST